MSKNTKEQNIEQQIDSSSKIETIKNLIFGDNIQQYNSEFESLKKEIVQKREELKALVEETHQEINTLVDNLSTDLNIRITELEGTFSEKAANLNSKKVDKETLGALLIKIGNQISE